MFWWRPRRIAVDNVLPVQYWEFPNIRVMSPLSLPLLSLSPPLVVDGWTAVNHHRDQL